MTSIYKSGM